MAVKSKKKVVYTPPPDIAPGTKVYSEKNFDFILADPAWKGPYGTESHYDTMKDEDIINMPVESLAADNAVLFLWTTNGALPLALEVMKAWGFKYRTNFIWCKPYMGQGDPLRNSTEMYLVGLRGHLPASFKGQMNWSILPRQEHSHKPEEVYVIAERLYPNAKRLELFARHRSSNPSWYAWGNECDDGSDIYIPGYPVPKYSDRVKFIAPEKASSEPATYKGRHTKEEA